MLQYLEDYNLNDVRLLEKGKIKFKKYNFLNFFLELLFFHNFWIKKYSILSSKAIISYAAGFYNQWGINIHDSMSLPGVAEKLAYIHYDETCVPIFSFGENFKKYNEGNE